MKSKLFLHFSLVHKFGMVLCETPKQFSDFKNFTFYRLEKKVADDLLYTFYLTNLDIRCEKGGSSDGKISDNCWCLFTFLKGKRAIFFYNIETLNAMNIETLNNNLDIMYNSLNK